MAHAIGIDFGTTELRVAIYAAASSSEPPTARLLRQGKRELRFPAAVAVDGDGSLIAGDRARRLQITRPRSTVLAPLALLGARYDDLDVDAWAPLQLVRDARGGVRVRLGGRVYAPVQLVAAQLIALRATVEEALGEALPPAVVTIPAGLGNLARRGLVDACTIAGVDLLRLMPATTAAALELHAAGNLTGEPTVALCDLGSGSFSAAVVELGENAVAILGSASALGAGSRTIDGRLAERLTDEAALACEQPDLAADPVARVRLRDAAEKAKIDLSSEREREIHLPFLTADASGPKHLETILAQGELEGLLGDLVERWTATFNAAVARSGRELASLDEVFLLGRGAQLPLLQDRVEAALGRTPELRFVAGDLAARGAARAAAIFTRDPTVTAVEIDDVLGRPIILQRDDSPPPVAGAQAAGAPPDASAPADADAPADAPTETDESAAAVAVAQSDADADAATAENHADDDGVDATDAPALASEEAERATERDDDDDANDELADADGEELAAADAPAPAPAEPAPRPTDDLEPELLFPATISLPASHTELFETDPQGDAPTAHFHLSEGDRGRYALGEHVLRGRPAIDLTFNVDANGILSLSFRESFRGRQAVLEVFGAGGMSPEEVEALAEHQRAVEEALRRQRRTQALKLRLGGLRERGLKVLTDLAEGIPEGDRDRLRATFKAIHDAVVSGSLSALEAANEGIDALLAELPAAIQQALVEPNQQPGADAAKAGAGAPSKPSKPSKPDAAPDARA
ncbi:MAG: Hsp70 family protein [Nannocystaceae bacterium]